MAEHPADVTVLLAEASSGRPEAWGRLLDVVHSELHAMAHRAMRRERPGHTLQTTALVNEAYLRLAGGKGQGWRNRACFFSVAGRAMRRILVDRARRRGAIKRGGGRSPLPMDHGQAADLQTSGAGGHFADLEALDRALSRLAGHRIHRRKCAVVELRFFVGLTVEQAAEALGVSQATVARDWDFARAWLYREIEGAGRHDRRS